MKVVILCGGHGTRIRGVADDVPKPMIAIGRFPILWHIMKHYARHGHRDFVLCLGYKGQVVKDFFLNYETNVQDFTIHLGDRSRIEFHTAHPEADWRVTHVDTGLDAMTGARIRRIRAHVAGEKDFLLTYGDGVGDVDIPALIGFHRAHGRILTVTGVRPPGRFGELDARPDGLVTSFAEKPQATAGLISGGFFACRQDIFDYLDDREDLTFENEPMHRLVADGQLMVFEHDGFWQPMDTHRDYQFLNGLFASGKAPWVTW